MDALFSPFITTTANLLAGILVSKGIIDNSSKMIVAQLINNSLAAFITLVLGVYSIRIAHQSHKLKMQSKSQCIDSQTGSTSLPVTSVTVATTTPAGITPTLQTGLPLNKNAT